MTDKQKVDRRVRHTKKFIREALIELLKEKYLSQISIAELCRKADINRNTFYCHYTYPEDVLHEMEEEFIHDLQTLFDTLPQQEDSSILVLEICKLIKKDPTISHVIFRDGEGEFLNRLIALSQEKNIYNWKEISKFSDNETADKFYRFTFSGATSIIKNWCNNGFKESPEEIVDFIIKISLYGMNGFIPK